MPTLTLARSINTAKEATVKTSELIAEAVSLPVEDRALMADTLLRSLNPPETDIDAAWAKTARTRLDELRSGKVEPIPGEVVFERIRQLYAK